MAKILSIPKRPAPNALARKVDALAELRDDLRRLQEAERALAGEIKAAMLRSGERYAHGTAAVAILDERTNLRPDPARFIEAVGEAGVAALRVDVTEARKLMLPAALEAISEKAATPVLRCEAIRQPGGAA